LSATPFVSKNKDLMPATTSAGLERRPKVWLQCAAAALWCRFNWPRITVKSQYNTAILFVIPRIHIREAIFLGLPRFRHPHAGERNDY